jgi:hypothetical protein
MPVFFTSESVIIKITFENYTKLIYVDTQLTIRAVIAQSV